MDPVGSYSGINKGKLLLHKYIMTNHPSLVAEFIQYDYTDYFYTILFQCAVADLVKAENDHGKLTDIFRY